jgi:hypothetical protein
MTDTDESDEPRAELDRPLSGAGRPSTPISSAAHAASAPRTSSAAASSARPPCMQTASNRSNDFSKFNAALEASTHIYADYERAKVEQELARDGITSPESG